MSKIMAHSTAEDGGSIPSEPEAANVAHPIAHRFWLPGHHDWSIWKMSGCDGWRTRSAEARFLHGEYDQLQVRYSDGQIITHTVERVADSPGSGPAGYGGAADMNQKDAPQ